jgi:hypothetical protein
MIYSSCLVEIPINRYVCCMLRPVAGSAVTRGPMHRWESSHDALLSGFAQYLTHRFGLGTKKEYIIALFFEKEQKKMFCFLYSYYWLLLEFSFFIPAEAMASKEILSVGTSDYNALKRERKKKLFNAHKCYINFVYNRNDYKFKEYLL